jgi:hypothetical protein
MEVLEIEDYFVNKDNNMITVSFTMVGDKENTIREDIIEYSYMEEFGYNTGYMLNEHDVFDDEWDEWEDDEDDDDIYLDEDDLRSFLNEYYVVFPHKLPEQESI